MQDLIDKLKQEAGLTEDQAKKSLNILKDYIRSKVPPMFSGIVDNFLGKGENHEDDPLAPPPADDFKKKAETITNETKDKIEHIAGDAKEDVEEFAKEAVHRIDEWALKTEEAAKEAIDKLKGMMSEQQPKS